MPSIKTRILIVDDDERIVEVMRLTLEEEGYRVISAFNGKDGLRAAYAEQPDLILLDIMMPEMDGFRVLETLRMVTEIPIIMLTAAGQDPNRIRSLDKGATDFLPKSTPAPVLLAHIRSRLRPSTRWKPIGERKLGSALTVDVSKRQLRVREKPVNLTPIQWKLFQCLLEHEGHVSKYDELLLAGWGSVDFRDVRALKVQISLLREKLRDPAHSSHLIHTVREEGYLFEVR